MQSNVFDLRPYPPPKANTKMGDTTMTERDAIRQKSLRRHGFSKAGTFAPGDPELHPNNETWKDDPTEADNR